MPTPATAREVNGRAAVVTLTYLGFALQLVQVGLLPLLPTIGGALHASTAGTAWILTSGLISGAVFLAVLTRLADLIGKRPVILLAMALVLAGCVVCALATSLAVMIVGRVLIGAQLPMLALPEAIASDTMSPRRAQTAIFSVHVGTGLGVAGGLLLGALVGAHPGDWRLFFVISAVAALLALVTTVAFVRDSDARAAGGLDLPGALLLTLALVAFLLGLSQGPAWGWGSGRVAGLLAGGAVLGVLWWLRERSADKPLIDVSYLLRRDVGLPYAMTFLIAVGIYGSLSAITRLAQTPEASGFGYGWTALGAGWYALPQAIGSVLGIVVLRTARRRGLVSAAAIGFALIVAGFAAYAFGHAHAGATLPALALDSCGLAVTLAATQLLVVRAVPAHESGIALGLSVVMYAVGNSVGSAVFGVLFTALTGPSGKPALSAYVAGFAVCGACALLALLLCAPLGRLRSAAPATTVEGAPA
ncbi:MFS transporter [Actinomadura fibrosa]|uniref:MFS transporter n=1 Tax=Actinomadura fibrosa TaxID=111802 RepID=A0ABW2XXC5_9ACTN|nr:MFS transporter [Actinomadura fibrosa]